MRVAVVGGGVIGLSVAHRLLATEAAKFGDAALEPIATSVQVYSPQPLAYLTSSAAAAFWSPYWVGEYDRFIGSRTWEALRAMASASVPGVRMYPFHEWLTADAAEAFDRDGRSSHWWQDLPGMEFTSETLAPPRVIDVEGERAELTRVLKYRSVVVRMQDYLPFLENSLLEHSHCHQDCVQLRREYVDDLSEIATQYDAVVNCSGWGAKRLVKDDEDTAQMRLLAGHAVLVDAPELSAGQLFFGRPFVGRSVYVVPRAGKTSDVLCGGTAIDVTDQCGDSSVPLSRDTRNSHPFDFDRNSVCDRVIARARGLVDLGGAPEIARAVGLRPVRRRVRLEADTNVPNLFHAYGHGGSGLTFSWGSAEVVADLLTAVTK